MDCLSDDIGSTDTDTARGLSLREQRLRVQQLEKQNQAEFKAVRDVLENEHKLPRAARTLGNSLPNPRPGLQSIVDKQQRRLCTMVEQLNGLQHTLRLRESQLQDVERTLKCLELDNSPDPDERQYDQRVRQLENCLEKMNIKITEAENIYSTYIEVQEHLFREVRAMPLVLEKLQSTVIRGQVELSHVAQLSHAAQAAVESTKVMLVQMERQLVMERISLECNLNSKQQEKEREVEARMEREKDGDRRVSRTPQHQRKDQRKADGGKDAITDIIDSAAVHVVQRSASQPLTQQSQVKMVKEMDDLKDALGCTDLQELESRLVSQKATREQLHTQMRQCEELVAQRQEGLAALELQYAQSKFNPSSGSGRYKQMEAELREELEKERVRCQEWEAKLDKARAVLRGVEQGVNNLFYLISCLAHKESMEVSPPQAQDAVEKLQEIDSQLPSLFTATEATEATEKSEDAGGSDKLWTFLVQTTMMEPRNCKRVLSPTYNSNTEDTFQFRSHEEDYSLSRDEIKRRNKQLIEAHQPKKKATKAAKKD
ncbi:golgin subfamily A member 4-like [Engraulis encrasicolus]|uniref:golgin subfamily A member 4-like n=1 Tax=Engraulis encrasicolus TaxID=184585 RepID=UPI002FD6406D